MRTARSLLAGAALTACLAFTAPAAHATGAVNAYDPSGSGSSASTDSGHGEWQKAKGEDGQSWEGHGGEGHKPHGGLHTGGGGLSLTGGSSLAAGSALLIGGLGAGAWAVRRRRGTAGAASLA